MAAKLDLYSVLMFVCIFVLPVVLFLPLLFSEKIKNSAMSIQVENNLKDKADEETFDQRVHYVPCKIEDDGPANVEKYFEPYIQEDNNKELTATFRGYPLDGIKMPLPENYKGVVLTEAKRPLSEDADRRFQVAGGFKEIIYWNWDKKPSNNDNLFKAMDWIDIAETIHGD